MMFQLVQSALQSILAQIRSRTLKEFKEALPKALEKRKDVKVAADNCKKDYMKSFDDRCAGTKTNFMMPIVILKQKPFYLQVLELFITIWFGICLINTYQGGVSYATLLMPLEKKKE